MNLWLAEDVAALVVEHLHVGAVAEVADRMHRDERGKERGPRAGPAPAAATGTEWHDEACLSE